MRTTKTTKNSVARAMFAGLLVAAAVIGAAGCDTDEDLFEMDAIFHGVDSFGNTADDPFGWDGLFSGQDSFGQYAHHH